MCLKAFVTRCKQGQLVVLIKKKGAQGEVEKNISVYKVEMW